MAHILDNLNSMVSSFQDKKAPLVSPLSNNTLHFFIFSLDSFVNPSGNQEKAYNEQTPFKSILSAFSMNDLS